MVLRVEAVHDANALGQLELSDTSLDLVPCVTSPPGQLELSDEPLNPPTHGDGPRL